MSEKKSEVRECPECGDALKPNGCCPECLKKKPRVVVCAANRSKFTGKIICGARHWDSLMRGQVNFHRAGQTRMPREWVGAEQGFVDQFGNFMTREEAWKVAEDANQIKYSRNYSKGTLYSEDLY